MDVGVDVGALEKQFLRAVKIYVCADYSRLEAVLQARGLLGVQKRLPDRLPDGGIGDPSRRRRPQGIDALSFP